MKILKHGDLKQRKFTCKVCDCEFIASACEYYAITTGDFIIGYDAYCPECNNNTNISEIWEEKDDGKRT